MGSSGHRYIKRNGKRKRLPGYYAAWHEYVGSRRVTHTHNFETLAMARTFVREHNARLDLRTLGHIIPIALPEARREFITALAARARNTRIHYASALGWLEGIVQDRTVDRITGSDIDQFVIMRLRRCKPTTVAKHIRGLRRFFNWSISRNYAEHDPTKQATALPRSIQQARVRPHVSEPQLKRLLKALDTPDRKLACWLAMSSGLDRSIITQLATWQIDLDEAVIRFRRGKTGKLQAVPIHPDLLPQFRRRLDEMHPNKPILRGLSRESAERDWWRRATIEAGVEGLYFRDLRALATMRLQRLGGASLADTQRLLGHASPTTTAAHYYIPEVQAVQALERVPLPALRRAAKPKKSRRGSSRRQA